MPNSHTFRPGPKPTVPPKSLKEKLINYDLLDENFKLKNRSNGVWFNICELFENKIKPLNLYLMVKSNRHGLLDDYLEEKNLKSSFSSNNIQQDKTSNFDENSENGDNQVFIDDEKKDKNFSVVNIKWDLIDNKRKLEFNISCDWKLMKPKKKTYQNHREALVLLPGWGDIIGRAIYETYKLPCVFNFERHRVRLDGCFISFEGDCSECKNYLIAICDSEPADNDAQVIFKIITNDSKGLKHVKKRKCVGFERKQVQDALVNMTPKQWRLNKADKLMNLNDCESPFLYKLQTIQKAGQQGKFARLGIQPKIDIFTSLEKLKTEDPTCSKYI